MGVLFRQEARQWAPEPVIPPYPGWTGGSGTSIHSKEEALAVSTVWACVTKIANSVSLMPLETFGKPGDVPRRLSDPPIVRAPSPGMTQADFIHQVMVSLLLRGNAYAKILDRDSMMRPTLLELLDPDRVTPRQEKDGTIVYRVNGADVPAVEIWHVRGLTLPGSKVGVSPIAYGAAQMGIELSAVKFAKDFFDGGGIPKAVLQSDMDITQEQARTLKERLLAATRNREPVALGNGVKYTAISVKPDEAQFIATQQNAVSVVARFFDMPPEMVGGSSGQGNLTYANREQRAIDYATFTVAPWLKRLEDAWFPLLPGQQFVSFNEAALLRTDAETQAKVRVTYVAGKILPPSRILREMNEAPLTDAEKAELELVPLTVTPTGMPKALPRPPSPETSPDTPVVGQPEE